MIKPVLSIFNLIDALERLQQADRPCFIYKSSTELFTVVSPFLRTGLQRNEKCLYIVYDDEPEAVIECLEKGGIDASAALARGALEVIKAADFYPINEPYTPDRLHGLIEKAVTDAHTAGFDSLRLANDMKWIHDRISGTEQLVEHVAQMNDFYSSVNVMVLRLYNSTRLTSGEILDVIRMHPKVIFRGAVCSNFSYRTRDDLPRSGKADFEMERLLQEMLDVEKKLEELQTENSLMRGVIENTPDVIFLKDLNGRYLLINPAGAAFLGKKIEDVLGCTDNELFTQEDAEKINVLNRRAVECDKPLTIEKTLSAQGGTRVFLATKGAYCDQKGNITGTFGISRDITELKKSEEKLRDSEKRYRLLFETETDAILLADRETFRFLDANPAAQEMYGYSREEFLGLTALDITAEPEKTRQAIAANRIWGSKRLHRRKDGTLFPVEISGSHFEFQGRDVHVAAIRDISERKRSEEALRTSEERLNLALAASGMGVCEWDLITDTICGSEKCISIMGFPSAKCSLESFKKLLHPDDADRVMEAANRAVANKTNYSVEYRIVRPDGEVRWISAVGCAEYGEDGRPLRAVGTVQDITERKRIEGSIIAYQDQLRSMASELSFVEERARRKIATALHDQVGQTLSMASFKLGQLREAGVTGMQGRVIDEIREMLTRAIGSSRTLTFEISPPILYDLGLEAALSSLAEHYQEAYNIRIDCSADRQPKPLSNEMSILLFQGVRELLLNAVKHGKPRTITVSCRREGTEIKVVVEDDGAGFATADGQILIRKPHAFGLFSLRERLKYLGGSIYIKSDPGRGTQVTLTAPLTAAPVNRGE